MDIVYKAPGELIPYANNAKEHDDTQVKNLALSLDKYGWKQPVVIDRNNVIVAGHGRVLAAKQSRLWKNKPVPCIVADDLTEEQIKEFRLVDNKSAESAWDFDALSAELENINLSSFDFDFGWASNEELTIDDSAFITAEPLKEKNAPKSPARFAAKASRHEDLPCEHDLRNEPRAT